jgi:cytochrome c oxidase subunit III
VTDTARTIPPPPGPPRLAGRATGWWGMIWGLTAVASVHSTFIFAYFYLGALAERWPPPQFPQPALLLPTMATAVVLLSILPAAWAHTSVRIDDTRRLQQGGAGMLVLGTVFILLAAGDLAGAGFLPQDHAYASAYFVVSGFHLVTAVAGLLMIAVVQLQVWGRELDPRLQSMTVNTSLFWYYVAGGWLPVYATLHLSPYVWVAQ